MKDNLLINIKFKTELLESMNWDEGKLEIFYNEFAGMINDDILNHPDIILNKIKENYSETTASIVKKIFNEIIIKNNLHNADKGDQYVN